MKLTREQKIEIYEKRYKVGRTIPSLSNEYGIKKSNIAYLISLIDRHGTDILRKNENRYYSPELKLEIINKVLIQNQPVWATALEYGLSSDGMLHLWINRYKADGCVIIERKRGRSPTMIKEKQTKSLEEMTPEEKNKYYEETHIMENIIYNELICRGYSVDVGVGEILERNENNNYVRKQIEVDFVVNRGSKRYYIQSAYSLPNIEKRKQEERPLTNIDDSFKKIIIVKDNVSITRDDNGIVTMGIKDFLLNDNSLDL